MLPSVTRKIVYVRVLAIKKQKNVLPLNSKKKKTNIHF